ncbi:MAG: hypothetical protein WAZ18_06565 [Alphaproteobacteria bacterium]
MPPHSEPTLLVSTFTLEGGVEWRFTGKPLCKKSASALSTLHGNTAYLEHLISQLVISANLNSKFPTAQTPMTAKIQNPHHGDIKLKFWFECTTPQALN